MDNVASKVCSRCGRDQLLTDYYPDPSHRDGLASRCKDCIKEIRRTSYAVDPTKFKARNKAYYADHKDQFLEYNRKTRREALDAYGNRCACCGESTPEFLGIDHVNNDGEAHRRELAGYGRSIYRWLKMQGFPQDGRFQLLCHNCNVAKGCYGACPHNGPVPGVRRPRRPDAVWVD